MNKNGITGALKMLPKTMKKHSPEILTGVGIAGMIATTVMAVKSTPKAMILLDNKKEELNKEKLSVLETVGAAWICYLPATLTGVLSIACMIGASSVNFKRNATLAAAYTLSEAALKEYKDKVIEVIGEKKERTVRDSIAKDRINKNPVAEKEIVITEHGDTLCYDCLSGRYFKSDIDKLKKAENELNKRMLTDMTISLNEFYYEIGLSDIEIGNQLGWDISGNGYISLDFSSQLTEDGIPCLVIGHNIPPKYDCF